MAESQSPEVTEFAEALRRLPARTPITYALVAANVLVFAAMAIAGAGVLESNPLVHVRWGSNLVPVTVDGEWWRLGTAMFLHFGLIHLFVNMWVLYVNGQLVERMFGSARYLLLYLFAGLMGSLASTAWHPATNSAGASGAIFGVIGGMMAFFASKKSRVPREVLKAQARSIGVFAVYNIAFGLAYPGIDNAAHLGGAAGGFLIGLVLARPLTPESRAESRPLFVAGVAVAAAFVVYASADLVLALRARMPPEDRYAAAALWFEYQEEQTLERFHALVSAAGEGEAAETGLAARIEAEILPVYTEASRRLAWDPGAGMGRDSRRTRVARYVNLRRDGIATYVHGLRSHDRAEQDAAVALMREADALAQSINAQHPAGP
jgi:rhomboid protease GluP